VQNCERNVRKLIWVEGAQRYVGDVVEDLLARGYEGMGYGVWGQE
jgi:hypothetical protein